MTANTSSIAGSAAEAIIRTVSLAGSLTLSAVRQPTGWAHFSVAVDEGTTIDLLGEDAGEDLEAYVRTVGPADTWQAALGLLDCFAWPILHPDCVHPEFRQMVIAAVRERAAEKDGPVADFVGDWLPEWERECSFTEEV